MNDSDVNVNWTSGANWPFGYCARAELPEARILCANAQYWFRQTGDEPLVCPDDSDDDDVDGKGNLNAFSAYYNNDNMWKYTPSPLAFKHKHTV